MHSTSMVPEFISLKRRYSLESFQHDNDQCPGSDKTELEGVPHQISKIDFSRMLKVQMAPITLQCKMSVLPYNLKVYIHGGGKSDMFFG